MKVKVRVAQSCPTLCNPVDCRPRNCPGQNTGVGSISLLQGIILTQESNWDLLHCRQILCYLSYQGSPKNVPEFYQIIELEEGDLGNPGL